MQSWEHIHILAQIPNYNKINARAEDNCVSLSVSLFKVYVTAGAWLHGPHAGPQALHRAPGASSGAHVSSCAVAL